MLTICCWLWNEGFRDFRPEHVNVLQRMVARHLKLPHTVVCITDETKGFSPAIEVIKTPAAAAALSCLKTPEGGRFPSCYRRLWTFSEEAKMLGERVLLVDIDLVVVNDLAPIFEPQGDFIGWRPFRDWGNQCRFGGGIYLLRTGTRTKVWTDFKGAPSIAQARAAGFRGSDQAWLSYKLGASEPYWQRDSGIYSVRDFQADRTKLPIDARLVQCNGPEKPWASQIDWIKQHWN